MNLPTQVFLVPAARAQAGVILPVPAAAPAPVELIPVPMAGVR